MTSIMLSTIGIILAALSALLMMDYGGSYFVAAAAKGDASSLRNAGQNVYAATSRFESIKGSLPASLDAILPGGAQEFLDTIPQTRSGMVDHEWRDIETNGTPHKAFVIHDVSYNACAAVNLITNNFPQPMVIPGQASFSEGCFSDGGVYTYYRVLDGQDGTSMPYSGTPGKLDFG